jgi:uroporphyrinogen III methyltransferase/synthase
VTVYLVGAGPGDPGLLTRRGATLLSQADVVMYDRLVHPSVLELAAPEAELVDVGKQPDARQSGADRQDEINRLLVAHGQTGRTVVRLKGGDPFLFGRGGEEAEALTRAGVPWQIVPGVSSAFAVPAAAHIPVTHRGLSSSVTVVTGRVGDPEAPGGVDWELLAKLDGTLVILMGMMTRQEIADALQRGGKPADTPIAVVERGTTARQRVERTTLDRLAGVELDSPAVIVVGPVAAMGAGDVPDEPTGPLTGRSVVVTRSGHRSQGLVVALQRAGATAIEVPLTRQADAADGGAALRDAAAEVERFAWVVLTSVNAVDRFMGSLRDARALSGIRVAAVGPATGDALRMAGIEPDLVPAEHWALGLIEEFPEAGGGSNTRVLFPCADQAPSTIPDGLAEKGWDVRRVEAYRTVTLPPPGEDLMAQVSAADAVTVTASSSARAFVALFDQDGTPRPFPPLVVCMGPVTAATARSLGMTGVQLAHGASTAGIVSALVEHLARPEPHGS